jgi:hypothetical protein
MTKLLVFLFIPVIMIFTGCEKRKFVFVASPSIYKSFRIIENSGYSKSVTITREDILGSIDIPKTATVKKVNIESIGAKVLPDENNVLTAILASGKLKIGTSEAKVFENFPIPLIGRDIPVIGINSIIESGVDMLKDKIESYLLTNDTQTITFEVTGTSVPANLTIHLDLIIYFNCTIEYEDCIDALPNTGDDC